MFKTQIYATQSILKTSKRKTSHISICIYFFDEQEKDKSLSGTPDFSPDWR